MTTSVQQVLAIGDSKDAARAIGAFGGFNKLLSWLHLVELGLPTLRGIIVPHWSRQAESAIQQFAGEIHASALLLRSDKVTETGAYPAGGFLVEVQALRQVAQDFLAQGRILFLLEPVSPFSDLYSLSLGYTMSNQLIIELVGRGFDASDLKRGQETPHESYRIELRPNGASVISDHSILSRNEYQASWRRRVSKVGRLLQHGSWDADEPEPLATGAVLARLSQMGEPMLGEARDHYERIPADLIEDAIHRTRDLQAQFQARGMPGTPLVVSMSYVGRAARPVYWDTVWPSLKYARPSGKASGC